MIVELRLVPNAPAVAWFTEHVSRCDFNQKEEYPGWGSNPHDALASGDFKSPAYAIPPPGPGMAKLSYQIAYGNMSRMELASRIG